MSPPVAFFFFSLLAVGSARAGETRPAEIWAKGYVFDAGPQLRALTGARALEWKEIAGGVERVVYVGERHLHHSMRAEVAARMSDLRAAGITHFGLEMEDTLQPAFDSWARDGEGEKTIRDYLVETQGPEGADSELELLRSALGQGLVLVALDMPRKDAGQSRQTRDRWMADNLLKILRRDAKARIIVQLGSNHVRRFEQPQRLRDLGFASRSYCFLTSGMERTHDGRDLIVDEGQFRIAQTLAKGKVAGKRLLLPLGHDDLYDAYIVIPAVVAQVVQGFYLGNISY